MLTDQALIVIAAVATAFVFMDPGPVWTGSGYHRYRCYHRDRYPDPRT
jgi:hypothetical protein